MKPRTLALDKVQTKAQGIWDGQDVRKQNGRIESIPINGLQGHLAGQLRRFAEVEKIARLFAGGVVLWKVPTSLAHQPDWGTLNRLALERPQEEVVLKGLSYFLPRSLRSAAS
jgi:hypothetical protein